MGLVWGWEVNGVAPERALSPAFHLMAQSTSELFKPIRKLASPRIADSEDRDEETVLACATHRRHPPIWN